MPVLVNKGDQPTAAAWLFFSPRSVVEELIETIQESNLIAGVINVDPGEGKPKDLVEVHLAMAAKAPEDDSEKTEQPSEPLDNADPKADLDLQADPEPQVTDAVLGSTTREAAERYLQPREVDGKPWSISVPDLAGLANFAQSLLDSSHQIHWIVWSIDPQGILRLVPAKDAKPMAGNILRVKL